MSENSTATRSRAPSSPLSRCIDVTNPHLYLGMINLASIGKLTNVELLAQMKCIVRRSCATSATLVAHLAELDARRLFLAEGCSSTFTYCTQVLHLSESATYASIRAARAARQFPVVLDGLASGDVNLTTILLLAPLLTGENHRTLLAEARHKSKLQIQELVARVRPLPPVPDSIRRLPGCGSVRAPEAKESAESAPVATKNGVVPEPGAIWAPENVGAPQNPTHPTRPTDSTNPMDHTNAMGRTSAANPASRESFPDPASTRAVIAPLAPERYRVQFTASAETHAKLRQAQDLLRHQIPDGDPACVIDRALTVLLQHLAKEKLAAVERPRRARPTAPGSRHIPAAVRREVWRRDGGRCAFVGRNGRCSERGFLHFHHVDPHGDGGPPTVENIQLHCAAHNQYEAELYFGPRAAQHRKKVAPAAASTPIRETGESTAREVAAGYMTSRARERMATATLARRRRETTRVGMPAPACGGSRSRPSRRRDYGNRVHQAPRRGPARDAVRVGAAESTGSLHRVPWQHLAERSTIEPGGETMHRFYDNLNAAMLRDRAAALARFQEWERTQPPSDLAPADAIAAIGFLYDLLPPASRQRPEDATGIALMHRALAALSRRTP